MMRYLKIVGLALLMLTSCSTPKEIVTHDTIHYINEHYNTIYDSVFVEHKNKEKMKNDTVFIYDSTAYHHYHFTHDTITNDTTIYINKTTTEIREDPKMKSQLWYQKIVNSILLILIVVLGVVILRKRIKL